MDKELDPLPAGPIPVRCSYLAPSADGRTVVLSYRHDDGRRLARIEVAEDTEEVRVTVWVEWRPDAAKVTGETHVTRRTFPLPSPLGGRRLVDGADRAG